MKIFSLGSRKAAIAVVCLTGTAGIASITSNDLEGHKSSLHAKVTMADGSTRTVTLRGVGCPISMCSRVRARDIKLDSVWLDGLASVRDISHDGSGPIKGTFKFKDGAEREVAIVATNRVLYIAGWFGLTETLDLARVTRIDFE